MGREPEQKPRATSSEIALGGIFSGLCLVAMLLTAVLPFSSYAMACLCGMFLIPVKEENGNQVAWFTYATVSFLSLIIAPDKLAALTFVAFFGYYPIIQSRFDAIRRPVLRWAIKLIFFNLILLLGYVVAYHLFGLTEVMEEMRTAFWIGLLINGVMPNIVFVTFDVALKQVTKFYQVRIRKDLLRK